MVVARISLSKELDMLEGVVIGALTRGTDTSALKVFLIQDNALLIKHFPGVEDRLTTIVATLSSDYPDLKGCLALIQELQKQLRTTVKRKAA